MVDSTILTITSDDNFLSLFKRQLHAQMPGGGRLILAATVDEACSLLKTVRPRLIVMHWTGEGSRYHQLDRLLWETTVQARPAPVVVIAERYRIDQATMMYRMGVSEYVSRTHHIDQLGPVLASYLPVATEGKQAVSAVDSSRARTWGSSYKSSALASQAC